MKSSWHSLWTSNWKDNGAVWLTWCSHLNVLHNWRTCASVKYNENIMAVWLPKCWRYRKTDQCGMNIKSGGAGMGDATCCHRNGKGIVTPTKRRRLESAVASSSRRMTWQSCQWQHQSVPAHRLVGLSPFKKWKWEVCWHLLPRRRGFFLGRTWKCKTEARIRL